MKHHNIAFVLAIASISCFPVKTYTSTFDTLSTSRINALPSQLRSSLPSYSVACVKRNPSSSRLSFTSSDSIDGKEQPWIRPAIRKLLNCEWKRRIIVPLSPFCPLRLWIDNSPLFRAFAIVYALLFAVYQSSTAPATAGASALHKISKHIILAPKAAATLHILSFGTWFGTIMYTTFVAGITMFKNLPRRTFGKLQSKLFPLYFQLCTGMIGIQVSTNFSIFNFSFIKRQKYVSWDLNRCRF